MREVLGCLYAMMLAVLRARMQVDQQAPMLFGAQGLARGLRGYPHWQLIGPPPGPPQGLGSLVLRGVTPTTWPWETAFLSEPLAPVAQ